MVFHLRGAAGARAELAAVGVRLCAYVWLDDLLAPYQLRLSDDAARARVAGVDGVARWEIAEGGLRVRTVSGRWRRSLRASRLGQSRCSLCTRAFRRPMRRGPVRRGGRKGKMRYWGVDGGVRLGRRAVYWQPLNETERQYASLRTL